MRCFVSFVALLSLISPANAFEQYALKNGMPVFAESTYKLSERIQRAGCNTQIFSDKDLTEELPNGRYETNDFHVFMVQDSCLMPRSGETLLADNSRIEFYQKHFFSEDGELMFVNKGNEWHAAPNGSYQLKSGQSFSITNGTLSDHGEFDDGKIIYPDRN